MNKQQLVAVTRRIPQACEDRLAARHTVRFGNDDVVYGLAELVRHAEGADAILVAPTEAMNATVIAALPSRIKVISTMSVGYEHIDIAAAKARGIRVGHTPDVLTDATADIAMLLILAATRRAGEGDRMVREDRWKGQRPTQFLATQITGKRLGIVGMGRIGVATALRAKAFGMRVLYHNRRPSPEAADVGAEFVGSLDDLLSQSDVLSLHCPLTPETKNLLNAARIARLPDNAYVVNTARGGLVDDDALITALQSGKLAGAGLDVFNNEPRVDERYRTLQNVFLLPHVGSATIETRIAMGMRAIDNIEAVFEGREPPYPVV
jgi:lactate dehydrogenase-like 2-hydroxyacid dehydrogenase